MKSGFVALVGRPNVGKSTILNCILGNKISIVTPKSQTTRDNVQGIYNDDESQIVFVDTPGIHEAKNHLGTYMNKEAYAQADGADLILYLVDASKGLDKDDKEVLKKIFAYNIPTFCVLNKIDEINNEKLIERCSYASLNYDFKEIIPISALNKDNIEELIKTCASYLKEGPLYYGKDVDDISSLEFKISEIIREKIILYTFKEVPHFSAVKIDEIKESDNKIIISASIIVNKSSHKGIIIGKNGDMLKKINMSSSKEIKSLTGKKVFLSLFVKVEEDWLNKEKKLFDLGYFNE